MHVRLAILRFFRFYRVQLDSLDESACILLVLSVSTFASTRQVARAFYFEINDLLLIDESESWMTRHICLHR